MATALTDSRNWWNAEEGEVYKKLLAYVRTVENFQAELFDKFVKLESCYDTNPRTNRHTTANSFPRLGRAKSVITENLIASNVDTVAAYVANTDVRARVQTDGADWSHERTAKKLERYLDGLQKIHNVGEKCRMAFKTGAALKGTGAVKVWTDRFDRINVRAIPIDNIVVDEIENRDGNPSHLHYRDFYDKELLAAQFPKHRDEIDRAQTSGDWRLWAGYRPLQRHELIAIESWRLPIGPQGHPDYIPGRHVICIDGCDLLDEEFHDDHFPFAIMRWNKPVWGFYGISLAERILPHQNLLNRRNYQINRSLDLKADPITYVNQADQNLAVKTVNQIGSIAVYKTQVPITVDHQSVGKETYDSRLTIKSDAFSESGVNQIASGGDAPRGIETGAGFREWRGTTTRRFSIQESAFERLWLDVDWLIIDCCKKLGAKAPTILNVTKFGNEKIKWSEVDMDDLKIELAAASTLADTPAGRQQRLTELAQAGVITLDESRELLDHPDITRIMSLYNAMLEDIEWTIQRIEDGETDVVPEPYQNLDAGVKLMQKEYLRIRSLAPESVLEALSDWMSMAANILNPPQVPGNPADQSRMPGPPGAPGPMPPGAPPMMPGPGMPQGPGAQMAAGGPAFAPGAYNPMTA